MRYLLTALLACAFGCGSNVDTVPSAGGAGGAPDTGGTGGVMAEGGTGGAMAVGGYGGDPAVGGTGGNPSVGGAGGTAPCTYEAAEGESCNPAVCPAAPVCAPPLECCYWGGLDSGVCVETCD